MFKEVPRRALLKYLSLNSIQVQLLGHGLVPPNGLLLLMQGYLTYKKTHPPTTLPQAYA